MAPEEYYAKHQQAFRCAFDFLNRHFPPGEDSAWWEKTAEEIKAADDAQHGNQLATLLLIGVLDYLNEEYKRRYKHGGADTEDK